MYPLLADAGFFQCLRNLDFEVFSAAKAQPCRLCGGPLDTSHFPRKPRGAGELEEWRFSLCCRREGCRHRVTPPSLRFLGRKVFSAWVVILVLDFSRELGLERSVSRRTLSRLRQFWRERLSEVHPFMRWARGQLAPGTEVTDRPGRLLPCFGFPAPEAWIPVLRFFTHAI
jgi:hypothetical protein